MIFSIKDMYRHSVEADSGGKNTVLYDELGYPSVMVVIPMFRLSDINPAWPNDPHPAFIVNGRVQTEIFVSKFPNIVTNGRAYSLPAQDPVVGVTINQARSYCSAKGKGWHLMTNPEWAAIALWCKRNNFLPRGNNFVGCDSGATYENGRKTYDWVQNTNWNSRAYKSDGANFYHVGRTATGSGPASWYHDNTRFGIADLNGNVWEWVDGLMLVNGKIYVHGSLAMAQNNFETQNVSTSGWLDTQTYFDNSTAGSNTVGSINELATSDPILSNTLTNPMYVPDQSTDGYYTYSNVPFESLVAKSGFTPPDMLKHLAIQPAFTGLDNDILTVRNYGTRYPIRGGCWWSATNAGVFSLNLLYAGSYASNDVGFRSSYIAI